MIGRHASQGSKHVHAKHLKGNKGASVLEIVEDYDTNTFRAVYTVRFRSAVYVLHVFQKKSKTGIKTPQQDLKLVKQRLKLAQDHYETWIETQRDEFGRDSDSE